MLTQLLALSLFCFQPVQTTTPTPAETRMASYDMRRGLENTSLFNNLTFRSIGPRLMGGRVVDIIGFEKVPHFFYVAYASGGLWKTKNNGTTWEPLFDRLPSITIGDIAVDPGNMDRIWVGTGENNSSRSSYAGFGVFLSENGGTSWTHKGLADTHHIGRILIDPRDPDTVFVAAIGHLYSPNIERGVFKTKDGGHTWSKVLFIDEHTGIIDLAMDPSNPDRLYAAAWQRSRTAWNFVEAGASSGIYLSEDGGSTWRPANQGLPLGDNLGRIGLTISPSNPHILYACLDYQEELAPSQPDFHPLTRKKLQVMTKDQFLALDHEVIEEFLRDNDFHAAITADSVIGQLKADEIAIADLVGYIYDSNTALYDREVHGVRVYRSEDRGLTWKLTHAEPLREFVYSFGYYFGAIAVDPSNPETIYVMGVPFIKSTDGGKTFTNIMGKNVHVDHHALWIDPTNSKHLVLGNDGGIAMSWDEGQNWVPFNHVPVGQFYTVAYDMSKPYNIFGGLQDNGVWYGPSTAQKRYDRTWTRLHGGDGAMVQVDPRDNRTVYSGQQFGHYRRSNLGGGAGIDIFPRHQLKETPLRYNWITPFVLSKHHADILYMGANRLLRSLDRGETWQPISPDLTTNPKPQGDVVFGTITTIAESPHEFGTLYVGTDDGRLWITRGNGFDWTEISGTITRGLWVSGIEVSPHDKSRVFVCMTGYRNDDLGTYLFMSEDYGVTWRDLRGNLPDEPCNVIRQDRVNKDLLFLGTDVGLWFSLDLGNTWRPHQAELPNVPVYALEIHPRERELIAATHGRSVFVLELAVLSQIKPATLGEELVAFEPESIKFSRDWGGKPWVWSNDEEPAPHKTTQFWFFNKAKGQVEIEISHQDLVVFQQAHEFEPGVNRFVWDHAIEASPSSGRRASRKAKKQSEDFYRGENGRLYAIAGEYRVSLSKADVQVETSFKIEAGP